MLTCALRVWYEHACSFACCFCYFLRYVRRYSLYVFRVCQSQSENVTRAENVHILYAFYIVTYILPVELPGVGSFAHLSICSFLASSCFRARREKKGERERGRGGERERAIPCLKLLPLAYAKKQRALYDAHVSIVTYSFWYLNLLYCTSVISSETSPQKDQT